MLALSIAARPSCAVRAAGRRCPLPSARCPAARRVGRPATPPLPPRALGGGEPASSSNEEDSDGELLSDEDDSDDEMYMDWDHLLELAWEGELESHHVIAAAKGNPAGVNAASAFGMTVLHVAALHASWDAVRALLEVGADPNARTRSASRLRHLPGSTPLHFVVDRWIPPTCLDKDDHLDDVLSSKAGVVRALLAAGADATAADSAGWAPLHTLALTVYKGGWEPSDIEECPWRVGPFDEIAEMMSALLAAGASLDAPTNKGLTPRHLLLVYNEHILGRAAAAQLAGVSQAELAEAEQRCP